MKLHHSLLAAALLAAVSTSAAAQSTGVVTIGGTIVPSTCTVTIANGGIADFGVIDYATLNQTGEKQVGSLTLLTEIACSGATLYALAPFDNRAATLATPANGSFGLGLTDGGQSIGRFDILTNTGLADSVANAMIVSTNLLSWSTFGAGSTWWKSNTAGNWAYRAFGSTGSGPIAVTDGSFNVEIRPFVRGRNELQLTADTTLDGSATIELTYL